MNDQTQNLINFFKYQNGLKSVFRNTKNLEGRRESSAEHSWSVAMMVWFLTDPIEQELGIKLDQNRMFKMALIHDIVEIEAGDVAAWDQNARKNVSKDEHAVIASIDDRFNSASENDIKDLWLEHEKLETVESKIVKACDQLCPLIYRIVFRNDYKGTGVDLQKLDSIFLKIVSFSKVTQELYASLIDEIERLELLD